MSESCLQCQKSLHLCICQEIHPQSTHLKILILQHPQEPGHALGTARLAHLALSQSVLKIGLSWRNLGAALDQAGTQSSRWAVLYLGSGVKEQVEAQKLFQFVSQKGNPVAKPSELDGIVVLDGTWSQAKALWWRNPWLLKLNRVILTPREKSLYGELRQEPRVECLSTIESIGQLLTALGEKQEVEQHLLYVFQGLLDRYSGSSRSHLH